MTALRFRGVSLRRAGRLVIDGLDLSVAAHEFLAIAGPSGCGKSSLLRLAAGLDRPDAGDIQDGRGPVAGPDPRRGFIFQDAALFPWLTVLENLLFGPLSRGVSRKEAEAEAREWLSFLGLSGFAGAYPHQLSGGMQRRVAIARVLMNRPEVLLCDEPLAGLDWMTAAQVLDELLRIWDRTGMTVLYVTNALDEAVYAAQRVVLLTPGPARVARELLIDLPRRRWEDPDLRYSPAFAAQLADVQAALEEVAAL